MEWFVSIDFEKGLANSWREMGREAVPQASLPSGGLECMRQGLVGCESGLDV